MQRVRELLNSDLQLSVRIVANQVRINKMTVHAIVIKKLAMRKIRTKIVPKILTDDQNQRQVSACEEVLQIIQEDHWLSSQYRH